MPVFSLTSFFRRTFGLTDHNALRGWEGENYSGKGVTETTALTISTVWSCVKLVSESIASLPLGIFENDTDGNKVLLRDSDLYRLVHESPNADETAFDFWQAVIALILLWGNCYILKTYRGAGASRKLTAFEILDPAKMGFKENPDGSLTYLYSDIDGRKEYSEDQIAHFRGFRMKSKFGLSVIRQAANTIGNSLAMQETTGRLYSNGMRPSGALTVPGELKKEQREQMRTNIAGQVGGVSKTGGIIVLEHGMSFTPLSIPPEDAQMLESCAFSVEEICRWFGVPPILIGHSEKTTSWGTGIEQINLGFLQYTITPMLKRIESQVKRSMMNPGDRKRQFAEFNVAGFLRADSTGRAALYGSASQNGWMTRAEIRAKENLPSIPGSDKLTVQSNLVPLDQLGQVAAPVQNRRTTDPGNAG